jgi:post-segregation antitoxin (ccd killing protein)
MNTATGYARLNITLPKDVAEYVRSNTANISKYIAEAVNERIARILPMIPG